MTEEAHSSTEIHSTTIENLMETREDDDSLSTEPLLHPVSSSTSSEKTKPLPREADSLIRSLLLDSLDPEEAEILQKDEDYFATAIANLKAELSAKLKAKAREISSGSAPSHDDTDEAAPGRDPSRSPDKLRTPSVDSESKEEEEKTDRASRSRTLARKKQSHKRRSSLEKLHDALREMNFDSMMPLGPRRTTVIYITN